MAYFLCIDQGTTSSRALIINQSMAILGVGQHEISQYYPQPGWVEHDPEQIWSTVLQSCFDALNHAQLKASELCGLGITNQRETTVIWDRETHRPIYPAIVWQDRRTATVCERLRHEGYEKLVQAKTGLLLDPYFSATKIQWILSTVPGARARAEAGKLCFGTIETWLLWRLTRGRSHFSDVTNASRTLLFNIHTQTWDETLLDLFNIPKAILPEIVDNYGHFGEVDADLLGAAKPIAALAGDQQAAAFGQACFGLGMAKMTYGTGGFLLVNTGTEPRLSKHRLLTTIQYRLPQQIAYAMEGSLFIAGAAIQWLRDNLKLISEARAVETLAKTVIDNGGTYFVPALTGLGAPYWNPHAQGILAGLTRNTQPGHIARATLEAIAYQTQDLLQAIGEEGIHLQGLRVDGGMAGNDFFMQLLSTVLNIPIERPQSIECSAQGIAFLIGLSQGVYGSVDEVNASWQPSQSWEPQGDKTSYFSEHYQQWQAWVRRVNQAYF